MEPLERTEKRKPTTVRGKPTTRRAALLENMEKPEQVEQKQGDAERPCTNGEQWIAHCATPESMTHLNKCTLRTAVTTSDLWCANAKAIQLAQEIENFIQIVDTKKKVVY